MIDKELLDILCCPQSHQGLRVLAPSELAALNGDIARGDVKDSAGKGVREPLDEGLATEDGRLVYPVRGGIPVLLVDSAIPLGRA